MNELQREYRPIEEVVRGCKYPSQRIADDISRDVQFGLENEFVRTGLGLFLVGGAYVASGLAYANEVAAVGEYSFYNGLWDGMCLVPDLVLTAIDPGNTWASDGTRIMSEPNNGKGYDGGFFIAALPQMYAVAVLLGLADSGWSGHFE